MGAAVQLEGRLVGGDAVGAGDSRRGGCSGAHWKDRAGRGGGGGRRGRWGGGRGVRGARGRGDGGWERREVGRRQGLQPQSRGARGRGGGGWERRGVCAGLGVGSKASGGPASEPRVQSAACVKALLPWTQGCRRSGWGSGSFSKAFTSLGGPRVSLTHKGRPGSSEQDSDLSDEASQWEGGPQRTRRSGWTRGHGGARPQPGLGSEPPSTSGGCAASLACSPAPSACTPWGVHEDPGGRRPRLPRGPSAVR